MAETSNPLHQLIAATVHEAVRQSWKARGAEFAPYNPETDVASWEPVVDALLEMLHSAKAMEAGLEAGAMNSPDALSKWAGINPTRMFLSYSLQSPDGCIDRDLLRPHPSKVWRELAEHGKDIHMFAKMGHRVVPCLVWVPVTRS